MNLFQTPRARAALAELSEALDAEAAAGGETIMALAISTFTEEDPGCVSTAANNCTCQGCMNRLAGSLMRIGNGEIEGVDACMQPDMAH